MDLAPLLIRIGAALTMVVFGIHQLLKPEPWTEEYMPKIIKKLPFTEPDTTMRIHSLGNLLFGLWLFSGITQLIAAWVSLLWWVSILPFAFYGSWKAGMRDLSITFSLAALVVLLSN